MSKGAYVGVDTLITTPTITSSLSIGTLNNFFTISNGSETNKKWTLSDSTTGKIGLVPGNIGVPSSTASITLTAKQDLTNVVISGQYYTENNFDKITLTVGGTIVLNGVSGTSSLANRYTGALTSGEAIVLTYAKDSSQDADNESNTKFSISCNDIVISAGTSEVKSVARRVKKIYVGVNGIARKVKRAYVGITNLARKFFGGYDTIQKAANHTPFIQSGYNDSTHTTTLQGVAAENLSNQYALFAGSATEIYSSTNSRWEYYGSKYVYAVDKNLVVNSASDLNKYAMFLIPAYLDNYTVLAGGIAIDYKGGIPTASADKNSKYAYAYGTDFMRHDLVELQRSVYTDVANNGAGNGAYVIYPYWAINYVGNATAYNNNLIQTVISTGSGLDGKIGSINAHKFNNYAVFFGTMASSGSNASPTTKACAFDRNLNKITMPNMSIARSRETTACAATSDYIILAGGIRSVNGSSISQTSLEIYDSNLIKLSRNVTLEHGRYYFAGTNIDDWIIFCGGYDSGASSTSVDLFNGELVRTNDTLANGLYYTSGASVSNYAIFVGYGNSNNTIIFQGV